jgi:hypothetical protein
LKYKVVVIFLVYYIGTSLICSFRNNSIAKLFERFDNFSILTIDGTDQVR